MKKITIQISDAHYEALKKYLQEVGEIEKPTKKDIEFECQGYVTGVIQTSAVQDYVKE